MKVLVAGDTHGNLAWIRHLCARASENGCAGVLQLGDFGLWPADPPIGGVDTGFLDTVAEVAERHGVWLRFVDGNHDDHPDTRRQFPSRDDGIRPIRDGVLDWADRGAVWDWAGVRFGALGGGISIDRQVRTPGRSWWPTEATTMSDVDTLLGRADGHVDVLVCHDTPFLPHMFRPLADPALAHDCERNHQSITRAAGILQPVLLLHGHYHVRHRAAWNGVRIEGFAADYQAGGYGVLTLPDLKLHG